MTNILGFNIPIDNFFSGVGGSSLTIIFATLLFAIAGAVVFYFIYMMRIYRFKVIFFENVSGQGFQPVLKDSARLIKVGDGGEELLWLRKKKVYKTAYGRKMGKNTFWFARGQDGYDYNIILGDVDAKMGMLDIEPIDKDMRYMNTAVRKNIQDRMRRKKMDKAVMVTMGGLALTVLIMMIGGWFLLDKMIEVSASTNVGVETANRVVETAGQLIGAMDNICGGGSGLVPVE